MEDKSIVSVVVICFNHDRFVLETLESVRHQTYSATQLIIIDDCSTDNSVDVIRGWIEATKVQCTFVAHMDNHGPIYTVNEALSLATGEYIAMVAADDRWLPTRLHEHISAFENLSDDYGIVYSDVAVISEEGKRLAESYLEGNRGDNRGPEGDIFSDLLYSNFIPGLCVTIRRACFEKVGKYDESLAFEDYDMWLRIAAQYRFAFVPKVLAEYRIVQTSLFNALTNDPEKKKINAVTNYRIVEKALHSKPLSMEELDIAKRRLRALAEQVYSANSHMASAILWKTLKRTPTLRLLGILIASVMRIRYSTLVRLKSALLLRS